MNLQTTNSQDSLPPDLPNLQRQVLSLIRETDKRARRNRLLAYKPYNKQAEFHRAGSIHRERLFMAGNQLGKTLSGSFEWAMHLTGRYPDWWEGKRFELPVRLWASGETHISVRDTVQKLLIGEPEREEEWGTGAIPGDALIDVSRGQGVPNRIDSATVKHESGGTSTLLFKAYEQGRAKWQGETLHGVWFDEEPPLDIYIEGLTRTNATDGITIITFTPLKGMSDVVHMFLTDADMQAMK